MGVPVYKRILDLFEAEGVNTCSAYRTPTSCTCSPRRCTRMVGGGAAPRVKRRLHGRGVSRMTGGPGLCIGTLGPGMANIAGR
jgi:hypothetical protein